jgi:hypothetical protein
MESSPRRRRTDCTVWHYYNAFRHRCHHQQRSKSVYRCCPCHLRVLRHSVIILELNMPAVPLLSGPPSSHRHCFSMTPFWLPWKASCWFLRRRIPAVSPLSPTAPSVTSLVARTVGVAAAFFPFLYPTHGPCHPQTISYHNLPGGRP